MTKALFYTWKDYFRRRLKISKQTIVSIISISVDGLANENLYVMQRNHGLCFAHACMKYWMISLLLNRFSGRFS